MELTFEQYDTLCESLKRITNTDPDWVPSMDDFKKYIEPDPKRFLEFLIWLLETVSDEAVNQNPDSIKAINRILRENIIMTD